MGPQCSKESLDTSESKAKLSQSSPTLSTASKKPINLHQSLKSQVSISLLRGKPEAIRRGRQRGKALEVHRPRERKEGEIDKILTCP